MQIEGAELLTNPTPDLLCVAPVKGKALPQYSDVVQLGTTIRFIELNHRHR